MCSRGSRAWAVRVARAQSASEAHSSASGRCAQRRAPARARRRAIKKRFGGFAHPPPNPALTPCVGRLEDGGVPAIVRGEDGKHFSGRKVAEVKVGRQPGGDVGLQPVARRRVVRQFFGNEAGKRGELAAAGGSGRHLVVDWQGGQGRWGRGEQFRRSRRPTAE